MSRLDSHFNSHSTVDLDVDIGSDSLAIVLVGHIGDRSGRNNADITSLILVAVSQSAGGHTGVTGIRAISLGGLCVGALEVASSEDALDVISGQNQIILAVDLDLDTGLGVVSGGIPLEVDRAVGAGRRDGVNITGNRDIELGVAARSQSSLDLIQAGQDGVISALVGQDAANYTVDYSTPRTVTLLGVE